MKRLQFIIAVSLLVISLGARAETIEMTVHGLVCGFCAQGIEKTFRKNAATEDVFVSLEHRLVVVSTKPGTDIADDTLRNVLRDAGYEIKEISRTDRAITEIRQELKASS